MSGADLGRWLDPTASSGPIPALIVLGLSIAVAFVLEWLHRTVFRAISRRTSTTYDDTVFPLLHRPLRNTVVLIGVFAACTRLGWGEGVTSAVHRGVYTAGIFLWLIALIRVFSVTVRRMAARGTVRAIQNRSVPLFDTSAKVFLTGLALYFFFLVWHIDVTAWVASAGIVGIAVGFAAKDTLANLFSGVFILVDAPYRIGDMILFDTGERGRVTDVGIRSTRILTRDDVEVIIPNATIGSAKIVNESGGPHAKRRVDVRVGVSYSSDIDRVREVLVEVAAEVDLVCESPPPGIRFREMGDSALIFSVLFWISDPEQRGRAVDSVNTRIFERFREENIEIPFPQRVVHWPGGAP